jgi:murein DD-endopeptidase MepM/ murein hydrolase activator NlpD
MNPQTLLNRPKPQIVPKITKISGLVDSSNEIKKSSTKLRKVFEKGTYQKKTQLTTLNRYKKRLDAIQKQNDKRFSQKSKVKIKLPDIKKYAGSFFTAGSTSDPLKSIAALAAFNSASKAGKGDWLGAVGPGLIAAGLLFGPGLIKGGVGKMFGGGRGSNAPMSGGIKSPKALSNKQLSRVNQSYAKFISKDANLGDKFRLAKRGYIKPGQIFSKGGPEALASGGGKVAKAFGKFGASIIPGIGAVVGAADATLRAQSGDTTGAAIAGAGAGLDAFAAASAATGIGLPLAGLASIASFGLDVTNLIRDLSGASDREIQKNKTTTQLKEQTKKQKESTKKKPDKGGVLTFRKTLNSYEKSVNKFEEFSKGFKGAMGMGGEQSGVIETGNRGLTTGDTLQDLEATGGEVPGAPDSAFGPRGGREHKGNDYNRPVGTPISIIQPGVVTVADMNYDPSGWGAVVEIRHQDGSISRYAHLSQINVAAGTQISPGQVIGNVGGVAGAPGSGNSTGDHLHFEYENGSKNYMYRIFSWLLLFMSNNDDELSKYCNPQIIEKTYNISDTNL